jgi:hypothetical protein
VDGTFGTRHTHGREASHILRVRSVTGRNVWSEATLLALHSDAKSASDDPIAKR